MTLADLMTMGRDVVLGTQGRAITYYAGGVGGGVSVTAAIGSSGGSSRGSRRRADGEGDTNVVTLRTVMISTDPAVYNGVSTPTTDDELEFDGDRWAVEAIDLAESGMASLLVTRIGRALQAHQGVSQDR